MIGLQHILTASHAESTETRIEIQSTVHLDNTPSKCYIFAVVHGDSVTKADSKEVKKTSAFTFDRTRHWGR
jgi:hypothetical protein